MEGYAELEKDDSFCMKLRHGKPFCSKNNFDRFIPYRPNLDIEKSHAKIFKKKGTLRKPEQYKDDKTVFYKKLLSGALDKVEPRILPTVQHNDSGYSSPRSSPYKSAAVHSSYFGYLIDSPITRVDKRKVTTSPLCIMDMPCLRDDFYTNILDWGSTNGIAVALQDLTYIWHAETKQCVQIDSKSTENLLMYYVSALSWNPLGRLLCIADNFGEVKICDPEIGRKFHHVQFKLKCPIGVVRWTEQGIFCGNRYGIISLLDPRTPDTVVTELNGHKREVCGLQLAEGTPYLASGGDEGTICIWDIRTNSCYRQIMAHKACSKALAWCPWRKTVLATGGGSSDGYIKLWHIHTGEKMAEIYTKSQICSVLWSEEYKELASSHGSVQQGKNDIILWRMNRFEFFPIVRLGQHQERPLHMSLSPDKNILASAGADEALCLWNCFPVQNKGCRDVKDLSPLTLERSVR